MAAFESPATPRPDDNEDEGSSSSMQDQLANLPEHTHQVTPVLQEALGITEKGKCIRHNTCPVLLFTKDTVGINAGGIHKIVSCRVCYAEEKSVGIRQGKSFSAVVTQLRNIATVPPDNQKADPAAQNPEVYNLHNSLGSLGDWDSADGAGTQSSGDSSSASSASRVNHILANPANTTAVMESIMKRLTQVHNWALRQKEKEILSLQLHINSLEQQLADEQKKTSEQKVTVRALRKTIQQDLKVIKTMATHKQREDEAAAVQAAARQALEDSRSEQGSVPSSPSKSVQSGMQPASLLGDFDIDIDDDKSPPKESPVAGHIPVRYFSPSKAYAGADLSPLEASPAKPKPRRNPEAVMAKQARRLERMQSSRSIEDPIIEAHDGEDHEEGNENNDMTNEDIMLLGDDDDDDDDEDDNKGVFTGNYWKDSDMKSLKASKIFQSFRGGLLDIPKSPPKARHDLDDDDSQNKNNKKMRRKKLALDSSGLDALKFPARGVLSRTNSSDEAFPGGFPMQISLLDQTPKDDKKDGTNAGAKDISLDNLAEKLASLPLSAKGATPEPDNKAVQQHPNMPAMSPLETKQNKEKAEVSKSAMNSIQKSATKSPAKPASPNQKVAKTVTNEIDILDTQPRLSPLSRKPAIPKGGGKDTKTVFSVTDAVANDKFGDEGVYTGDILVTEGLPHGNGEMKYESGRIYRGDWVCGQWHGHGKLLNPNGDTYTGEFFFDARHGQGKYQWDNGDVYEGSFVSDKRHGKGKFSFHNGNVYTGEFCDGMFEGYGRYDFEGGHYVGEWKEGRYHGSGELVYATGGKYTGEFRNSVAHGFGTEISADGRTRRGIWTEGKPSEGFA